MKFAHVLISINWRAGFGFLPMVKYVQPDKYMESFGREERDKT
jgi:hypothetical protein